MEAIIADTRIPKSAINLIILDYLVVSGFAGAAEKFYQESDLSKVQQLDLDAIKARVHVRNLIYEGRIQNAIEAINDINAEYDSSQVTASLDALCEDPADNVKILDTDSTLHFRLLQLQLIEIIRGVLNKGGDAPSASDFRPALEFATAQLSPHAPRDSKHLEMLEKTMALIILRPEKMQPEMKDLLDEGLREIVAEEVNQALLIADNLAPEARITELVKTRVWAEARAREANIQMPAHTRIGLDVERASFDQLMTS